MEQTNKLGKKSFSHGFIFGFLFSGITITYTAIGILRFSHNQDIESQIILAKIAIEKERIEDVRAIQVNSAMCAIEYFSEREKSIDDLQSNNDDILRLRKSFGNHILPCDVPTGK